ncbi:ATP-NAD kinase [Microthyrium microscopicum]|uniref:ATP-NAD kinase n=1 Tax=Microthyrium microscopicum TaxID=703497 RepID=A0A6A6U5S0_9PEZI|nr:ATP-NAD kinase [Microthyrium microscopicum]
MVEDELLYHEAAIHRRRSSIITTWDTPVAVSTETITDCFVHQLLDGHRKPTDSSPKHFIHHSAIPEDTVMSDKSGEYFHSHAEHSQSRLLSKKQLSDMAFNIRELSKTLSHMKLKLKVQNIFILGKIHDTTVVQLSRTLAEWLLAKNRHYRVYVEDTLEDNSEFDAKSLLAIDPSYERRLKYWDTQLCAKAPQIFDVVIALGGDGTVLYASWLFQRIVPPVLSFAMGSLGFLTKFDFANHQDILTETFDQGFNVNLRVRFEATVMRHVDNGDCVANDVIEEIIGSGAEQVTHNPERDHHILNEVVVDRGPNGTMITLEVFGDNEHFTTVQADGICVATPTGSTAYNLAAGGSLCHPDNPVVLLTAICAHTLSFRPIILPDSIVLRLAVPYDARTNAWASFDGKERVELRAGDYVTISASRFPFPSVLPLEQNTENWIDSISRTLNWNSRQRQKAFNPDAKS